MSDKLVTTYTMWNLFRNCRKAAHWRYVLELAPIERDKHLSFGGLIHDCLEAWHGTGNIAHALELIDAACPNRGGDEEQRKTWHLATAMMSGYARRYAQEDFEVLALEKEFQGEIVNPETGVASRSFTLAGKVDGIVRKGNEYFLLEHKTAAAVDASYLERLWTDFQITLYAYYLEKVLGIRISGVLYNILVKARLQQSTGETEAEFEERHAQAVAKSKSGKTSIKRRMPEGDNEFATRLLAKYQEPDMFHREMLYISKEQFATLQAELWELTQAYLDARRRDVWYQNTSYCFQYGRPCPYFALCRSGGSENVLANFYEKRPAHEELSERTSKSLSPAAQTETF
jgi:hypothetical protein